MIRCTIELLPMGNEAAARTIGCIEIANDGTRTDDFGNYIVVLKKTPPFSGALKAAWRKGKMQLGHEDEEIIVQSVEGHHRTKRGSYDLLYRALVACGLDRRAPR
jgi:hypothetical protein